MEFAGARRIATQVYEGSGAFKSLVREQKKVCSDSRRKTSPGRRCSRSAKLSKPRGELNRGVRVTLYGFCSTRSRIGPIRKRYNRDSLYGRSAAPAVGSRPYGALAVQKHARTSRFAKIIGRVNTLLRRAAAHGSRAGHEFIAGHSHELSTTSGSGPWQGK